MYFILAQSCFFTILCLNRRLSKTDSLIFMFISSSTFFSSNFKYLQAEKSQISSYIWTNNFNKQIYIFFFQRCSLIFHLIPLSIRGRKSAGKKINCLFISTSLHIPENFSNRQKHSDKLFHCSFLKASWSDSFRLSQIGLKVSFLRYDNLTVST